MTHVHFEGIGSKNKNEGLLQKEKILNKKEIKEK